MFGTASDPIDALGGPQKGAQSLKKFAEIQIFCIQAKTTGNTASKGSNYVLVWLLRIWWGRLGPKKGGTPPGGSSMLEKHLFRL